MHRDDDSPDKMNRYIETKIKSIYAQSWTKMINESDALWRIYSPQKTGVRIKIKKEYIYEQIKLLESSSNELYYYFDYRDVEYDKEIDYESYRNKESKSHELIVDNMPLLYMKRKAFAHEEEYRFTIRYNMMHHGNFSEVFRQGNINKAVKAVSEFNYPKVIYYNLPNEMIDEVLLDPRAPEYFEETFINYCKNKMFEERNIKLEIGFFYCEK